MRFIFAAIACLTLMSNAFVQAEIRTISSIADIREEIDQDTLVLFNIAEVLLDSNVSLGTQQWRKYVRSRVSPEVHDSMTYYIFQIIPSKPVELETPQLIRDLQEQGVAVFAFTSRGRSEWYSTITDPDMVAINTENVLKRTGYDFSQTRLPPEFAQIDALFGELYHDGIIYTGNTRDKGEVLNTLFELTGYLPSKIVFIDDKAASLESVEAEMARLGIPFVGFAYNRTALDHKNFDPMIAHIQLSWLLKSGKQLSDKLALQIKEEAYQGEDSEDLFKRIVFEWNELFK